MEKNPKIVGNKLIFGGYVYVKSIKDKQLQLIRKS